MLARFLNLKSQTTAKLPRQGLTLLEVLIGIFVLSIGMLGAAMLVVVGNEYAAQANVRDRAAACAEAAVQEIIAREMVRPSSWVPAATQSPWDPVVLDPLFLNERELLGIAPRQIFSLARDVQRLSWAPVEQGSPQVQWALSQEVFLLKDDLIFEPSPVGPGTRALPIFYLDPNATQYYEGLFSWMVMVQPNLSEAMTTAATGQPNPNQWRAWRVSVVVFWRRNLEQVEQKWQGRIFPPGGELLLNLPQNNSANAVRELLVPDRWILVSRDMPWAWPGGGVRNVLFYQWYRIISVVELQGSSEVLLRLDGPQWPVLLGATPPYDVTVTFVPDVVAVHDRVIHVD